jgi:hypothetical protein
MNLLIESILYNTDARIEMDENAYYVPLGNPTDIGFIRFL